MTKSNTILGITLDGFQVFAEPTYIPLDRLTLMFGPNSAGKSAVHDAIETFEALQSDSRNYSNMRALMGAENERASKLMKRHWRRTTSAELVETVRISVTHTTSCTVDTIVADYMGRELLVDYPIKDTLQLESCWILQRHDSGEFAFSADFEFIIESELFVSSVGTSLSVNLQHPIIRNISLVVDFAEVARVYPNETSYNDGFFTYFSGIFGFNDFAARSTEPNETWLRFAKLVDGVFESKTHEDWMSSQDHTLFLNALREINLLVGITLGASSGNTNFRSSKVDASRGVPSRSELTFKFMDFDDDMFPEHSGGDTRYKGLAESISGSVVHSSDPARWHQNTPLYAASVNRALTDHLFIEQGYSIDFDYRVLLSKENSQAAVSEEFLDPAGFGYLIELYLRDHTGRRHFFEDVGSGIGYVLPVLCALYEQSQETYFIQQPELHLHPALQAAMGDVLVEASANNQLLIETHSEHLLLRVLKRIRQTGLQVDIADDLKIRAEDVCVLYFDPQMDGTTKVKRLRISEDGEFMDRWPRGFFAERDQELLDE